MTSETPRAEIDDFCRARRLAFYLKADVEVPDALLKSARRKAHEHAVLRVPHIVAIIKDTFGSPPRSVIPLSDRGTFHIPYRVVLSAGQQYIVRTSHLSPWRSFDFYADAWIMGVLAREGLPTLRVHRVDVSRTQVPFDYEILEAADGRAIAEYGEDSLERAHVLSELGRTIARLHAVPSQGFGLLDFRRIINRGEGRGMLERWPDYILCNLDWHLHVCARHTAISETERNMISSAFEETQSLLRNAAPSLLHGDLNNHNVFTDGAGITALLDWEDCLSGDPVFDIASWGTFIGNDERRTHFVRGYCSVKPVPRDFEIRYWLYYLRVVLAKTVHRIRFGYHVSDRIPPAERIRKGLRELGRRLSGTIGNPEKARQEL